jgi:hypothetical protein
VLKRFSAVLAVLIIMLVFSLAMLLEAAYAAEANRFASIVAADRDCLQADGSEFVKFTVYLLDGTNQIADNQKVFVASSRGGTVDKFFADDGVTPLAAAGQPNVFEAPVAADGKAEFKVKSSITGTAKIGVGLVQPAGDASSVYQYLVENPAANASSVGLIRVIEIRFVDTDIAEIEVSGKPVPNEGTISGNGTKGSPYKANTGGASPEVNGNGVDYFEVEFKVKGHNGAPIPGVEVQFSTNYPQIVLSKNSATTDAGGMAAVRIYAQKSGTYAVKAAAGDKSKEVYFSFASNNPATWELSSMKIDDVVPVGIDKPDKQYLKLYDSDGSLVNPANLQIQNIISFEWLKQPEGSNLANDWAFDGLLSGKLQTDQNSPNQHMYYTSSGYVVVALPKLDKKGEYVLKMCLLTSGKSHEFVFQAGDFGEVTRITLSYSKALPLDSVSVYPKVYRYNAAGLSESVSSSDFGSKIVFSVSDITKLNPNKADLNAAKGRIHTTATRENKGPITVTAIDTVNNKAATCNIEINDLLSGIKVCDLDGNIPVNKETTGKIKLLDVEGKETYPGDLKSVSFDYVVTQKPEGAKVYLRESESLLTDLEDYGYGKFDIFCDKPGEVTFAVTLNIEKYKNDGSSKDNLRFVKEKTVRFVSREKYGAQKVVMFIGNTSYYADGKVKTMEGAPFILANRVYVPLRPVADELMAETEWDEESQTVTLKREDRVVTATIGSSLVKVSYGPAFMADGVPMIIDGRTFIPFRVIGEAFGVTVEPFLDSSDKVVGVEFSQ